MWLYPKIVAHRGAGILAPENTLVAMRYALAQGFKGVEFDVMLAQDDVPVLMHDPVLGRTVAGTGNVNGYTADELGQMDAGSWHSPQFVDEPVPGLAQVADFCRANGIWMNVEIKPVPDIEVRTGEVVARSLERLFVDILDDPMTPVSIARLPLVSSFSIPALLAARRAVPALPRALLVDRIPADWQAQCMLVAAVSLHVNQKHLNAAAAHRLKDAGLGLFCYTVNDVGRAHELLAWGVDGFCTDRLDLISPDFPALA